MALERKAGEADTKAADDAKAAADKAAADATVATEKAAADKTAADAKAATDKAAADAKAKADADAAAADAKAKEGQKAGGAEGELKLTVPEGAEDLVSTEQLAYFVEVAKASGWSAEDAQAEVAAHVTREKARIAQLSGKWADETKADTEIGGDKLSTTQRNVKAALDRFLPETEPDGKALRAALNAGGYGNWRPFVKLLARIGKAMSEDSPLSGHASGGEKSVEDTLYDHPSSKASA